MTPAARLAAALKGQPKRHKYGARSTEVDGVRFDSAKEARRYGELKLHQKAGLITDLELQPTLPIVVNGVHVCDVVPDFAYTRLSDGRRVWEDVKSVHTAKLPLYRLKRKLAKAALGVSIVEVR